MIYEQAELARRLDVKTEDLVMAAPDCIEKNRILSALAEYPDSSCRSCRPGHLTGSALIVHPTNRSILLLYHAKLKRWLQPGGHADGDHDLTRVALREATEETGIDGLRIVEPAIDVDVHFVDSLNEDSHEHYDVRFLVLAPTNAIPVGNHESEDLRWISSDDLFSFITTPNFFRLVERGLSQFERLKKRGEI